jgi:hypothetical protein
MRKLEIEFRVQIRRGVLSWSLGGGIWFFLAILNPGKGSRLLCPLSCDLPLPDSASTDIVPNCSPGRGNGADK